MQYVSRYTLTGQVIRDIWSSTLKPIASIPSPIQDYWLVWSDFHDGIQEEMITWQYQSVSIAWSLIDNCGRYVPIQPQPWCTRDSLIHIIIWQRNHNWAWLWFSLWIFLPELSIQSMHSAPAIHSACNHTHGVLFGFLAPSCTQAMLTNSSH